MTKIQSYCALCISRCGAIAVVENDRFVALQPDPSHPTGQALCAKGRAAPELVYHPDRLLYPMKRTRPKGDADPGWQRIDWDEALDLTAAALQRIAAEHGPESVVFSQVSASTSAIVDTSMWIQRLMHAFGSPNLCGSMELCGWGRAYATRFTYGVGMGTPGTPLPDLDHAGCILYWGYNPSLSRLSHATATIQALKRGAHLIVVDPRRVGLASKADLWLRVRPGSDAALALGIAKSRSNQRAPPGPFRHRAPVDRGRRLTRRQRKEVFRLGHGRRTAPRFRSGAQAVRTVGSRRRASPIRRTHHPHVTGRR